MLDSKLKPWLLEVNHAPSLATESAFDLNVKKKVVEDSIRLLNLNIKRKWAYINNQKLIFQKRILTGKTAKLSNEEKEQKRLELDKLRDEQEKKLLGGYKMIFPCFGDDVKTKKYNQMLETSREFYEFTTAGKKNKEGITLKALREQEE